MINKTKNKSMRSQFFFKSIFLAAFILRIALLFRPDDLFNSRPFIEDAYYSFSVARSIGHGQGFTVDGVQPTNGVQPLIAILYSPLFSFFSDEIALRFCLFLCIIIEFGLAYLCFKIVITRARNLPNGKAKIAGYLAASIMLWSYSSTVYTLNGLETALSVLLVLASWLMYNRWSMNPSGNHLYQKSILLGIVMGVMMLSRIDTVFFIVILVAFHLFTKKKSLPLSHRIGHVAIFSLVSFLISSPWWWNNYSQFGHIIPTSGLSQSMVIPLKENLTSLVQLILNNLLIVGYIPYTPSLTKVHFLLIALVVVFVTILVSIKSARRITKELLMTIKEHWLQRSYTILLIYITVLLFYYIIAFGAPHFLQRYLFVLHVVVICVASIIFFELWNRLSLRFTRLMKRIAVFGMTCMLILFLIPYSWNYNVSIARQNDFYQISKWISQNTSPSEKIGMGQSGTAGFFNRNVINLDGKVNFSVISAHRMNRFCAYVDSALFDYLIDWKKFFDDLSRCDLMKRYECVDSVGRFLVYKRIK